MGNCRSILVAFSAPFGELIINQHEWLLLLLPTIGTVSESNNNGHRQRFEEQPALKRCSRRIFIFSPVGVILCPRVALLQVAQLQVMLSEYACHSFAVDPIVLLTEMLLSVPSDQFSVSLACLLSSTFYECGHAKEKTPASLATLTNRIGYAIITLASSAVGASPWDFFLGVTFFSSTPPRLTLVR